VIPGKRTSFSSSSSPGGGSGGSDREIIRVDVNQHYIQEQSEWSVKLKVGGLADLLEGTKVKIRCPLKRKKKLKQ